MAYQLRNKATGAVIFDNVDAPVGSSLYVWQIIGTTWTRLAGPYVRPAGDEPGAGGGIVPSSGGMDFPANETQFRDALQTAANEKRMALIDPRVKVTQTVPIVIKAPASDGMQWGVNGNGARLTWNGPAGGNMLTYQGVNGVYNEGLTIKDLGLNGGGIAGDCLKLYAPDGDVGSLYKFNLENVYTTNANRGIVLEGAVFEGQLLNTHGGNHLSHGCEMLHTNINGVKGIISNILMIDANYSRNRGYGIKAMNGTRIIGGSFVLNAQGGIYGPEGLALVYGCNGENTGESLITVPFKNWGTQLMNNVLSSDGATVYRAWENNQWVSYGKPALYTLDVGADVVDTPGNYVSYYGGASPSPMRIRK